MKSWRCSPKSERFSMTHYKPNIILRSFSNQRLMPPSGDSKKKWKRALKTDKSAKSASLTWTGSRKWLKPSYLKRALRLGALLKISTRGTRKTMKEELGLSRRKRQWQQGKTSKWFWDKIGSMWLTSLLSWREPKTSNIQVTQRAIWDHRSNDRQPYSS